MALNLSPEADALISDYMRREAIKSKSAAVHRLIILTLGGEQTPQAQVSIAPQAQVSIAPQAPQPIPTFTAKFKL